MFGSKQDKRTRLFSISDLVRKAKNGISRADLARELDVSRATLTKDMSIVEKETGALFWEDDDGRLHWFE